ncbi:MAG TPA: sigma-70 family RNA polymerase sigma factor [Verrucomicrobiae bacterium]
MQIEDRLPNPSVASETGGGGAGFVTTHWSLVLRAGHERSPDASAALETLCRRYWQPAYAFVRRQTHSHHDAEDLTQEFFARLLRLKSLGDAMPEKGRFRTFLLTSLQRFLVTEWRKATRQKRGGTQPAESLDARLADQGCAAEPADIETPERAYEKAWALALMHGVLAQLGQEYRAAGKEALFEQLKNTVWGDGSTVAYGRIGAQLGLSEGAVKVSVHRLRQRCREILRAEVVQTVAGPEDVDAELRHLIAVFTS